MKTRTVVGRGGTTRHVTRIGVSTGRARESSTRILKKMHIYIDIYKMYVCCQRDLTTDYCRLSRPNADSTFSIRDVTFKSERGSRH